MSVKSTPENLPPEIQSMLWDIYEGEMAELHNEKVIKAYQFGLQRGQAVREWKEDEYYADGPI